MINQQNATKRRKMEEKHLTKIWESTYYDLTTVNFADDLVFDLKLYMDFTDQKCQRLDAILNYYRVAYKRSTSWFYLRTLEKD